MYLLLGVNKKGFKYLPSTNKFESKINGNRLLFDDNVDPEYFIIKDELGIFLA